MGNRCISLMFVLLCVCGGIINGFYMRRDTRGCRIPGGPQFRRSMYRLQKRWSTVRLASGRLVRPGATLIVTCKKDLYGDAIHRWSKSTCRSNTWVPELPSCKEFKRCRAPKQVPGAQASERINKYITFAHETEVTYTCDTGTRMIGNNKVVCQDGRWTPAEFECVHAEQIRSRSQVIKTYPWAQWDLVSVLV